MGFFEEYPMWQRNFGEDAKLLTKIPPQMWGGILRYIENGVRPGDFLQAVISDQLFMAAMRADDTNVQILAAYVRFFNNAAPSTCFGSPDAMEAWIEKGGMKRDKGV